MLNLKMRGLQCLARNKVVSSQMWDGKTQNLIFTCFFNAIPSDKSSSSTTTFNVQYVNKHLQIISQNIPIWEYIIFYG